MIGLGFSKAHGKAAQDADKAARKLESEQIIVMSRKLAALEERIGFDYNGDVSPARLADVIAESRSLTARGLPISAALLLLASGDARAREVAYSRELREAAEMIEARIGVAQLALAPQTWAPPKHADDANTKTRTSGLSRAQRAFLALELEDRFKPLRISLAPFPLDSSYSTQEQIAKRDALATLRAAYLAVLLLTQAEAGELWTSALRFYVTLRLSPNINKTMNLNNGAEGLRFTAPHLPLGVFRVFLQAFKSHMTLSEEARPHNGSASRHASGGWRPRSIAAPATASATTRSDGARIPTRCRARPLLARRRNASPHTRARSARRAATSSASRV